MAKPKIDKEFRDLVRPLTPGEFDGLRQNIIDRGCLVPLFTWNGTLIDGHHRLKICEAEGISYKTEAIDLADRDDAKLYILKHQLDRRNLIKIDRIGIVKQMEPLIAAKAKKKQREHGGTAPGQKSLIQKSGEVSIRTDKEAAKLADVSHDTYAKGKFILNKAPPDVLEKVRGGEMTINAAHNYTKKAIRVRVYEFLKDGEWRTPEEISNATGALIRQMRDTLYHLRRPEHGGYAVEKKGEGGKVFYKLNPKPGSNTKKLQTIRPNFPGEPTETVTNFDALAGRKFGTIYAAPPWSVIPRRDWKMGDDVHLIPPEKVATLPVGTLAADTSHLHIWAPQDHIHDAADVLRAWGFTPRGCFVWCKDINGTGKFWRGAHEILLFGVRGNTKVHNNGWPRGWEVMRPLKSKAKPERVRRLIEKLSPGPRLEVMGRESFPGWTTLKM